MAKQWEKVQIHPINGQHNKQEGCRRKVKVVAKNSQLEAGEEASGFHAASHQLETRWSAIEMRFPSGWNDGGRSGAATLCLSPLLIFDI